MGAIPPLLREGTGIISLLTLKRLGKLVIRHANWSMKTFGLDHVRGPIGPLLHLRKETHEIESAWSDIQVNDHDDNKKALLLEYVDAFFLLLDSYRRAGFTMEELVDGMLEKQNINEKRNWNVGNPDLPCEHVR